MKTLRTDQKQKGFTLLELLIAMSLLAIGLLAAASMQGTAANANYLANRVSVANNLVQQAAEDFLSLGKTDLKLNQSTGGKVAYGTDVQVPSAGTFRTKYQVTTNTDGKTQIDVWVYYVSQAGVETQAATVTTFKEVL